MENHTFNFSSKDELSLFGRIFESSANQPKGVVNLVHGLGEHSGRYAHVAKALTEAGYHLVGFDLRGHGLSEGKRGHSSGFDYLMDDIQKLLDESEKLFGKDLPAFLYGHSLGGSLVINFGLRRKPDIAGVISTSPLLATAFEPPKFKLIAAKVMSNIMPTFTLKNGLDTQALSRDPAVVKAYQDDVYNHDFLSARLGYDFLEAGQWALDHAREWTLPLLLMHGTEDKITSHIASQEFAQKADEPVKLILWEGYFHETQNDLGKEKVIDAVIAWLDERTQT